MEEEVCHGITDDSRAPGSLERTQSTVPGLSVPLTCLRSSLGVRSQGMPREEIRERN